MRSLINTVVTLFLVSALTLAFEFTGPSTSEPLDLLSPSIAISWDAEGGAASVDTTEHQALRLSFSIVSTEGTIGTWVIASQVEYLNVSEYEWDPSRVLGFIESSEYTLEDGEEHYFTADIHERGDNSSYPAGVGVESDKYAVEGYEFIGAAMRLQPCALTVMVGVAGMMLSILQHS